MAHHYWITATGLGDMHPYTVGIDEFVSELGHARLASG
jgi:hypothetical protein